MGSTLYRVSSVHPAVGIDGDDGRTSAGTKLFRLFMISELAGMRRARDRTDVRSEYALLVPILLGQRCEQSPPIHIAES
jgi:hypothetical protein